MVGVIRRVVVGHEVAGGRKDWVDIAGANDLGLDFGARHDVTCQAIIEDGLAGDAELEVAAIGCGDDALAGSAGARSESERERLASLLRRNDEAREAIGIRLQGEGAPADVAEDGGLRRVGREFERDDLARAVDVGWSENQAEVFRGNRPCERGETERGEEEAG